MICLGNIFKCWEQDREIIQIKNCAVVSFLCCRCRTFFVAASWHPPLDFWKSLHDEMMLWFYGCSNSGFCTQPCSFNWAFLKPHILLRYVDAFRFLFINVSLNKTSHNLYSSHIHDLCLPVSERSEQMHTVRGQGGQHLMRPPAYIEIKFKKCSIFHLSPCYLLNVETSFTCFSIFLPLFL